jgi:hypothetical protein
MKSGYLTDKNKVVVSDKVNMREHNLMNMADCLLQDSGIVHPFKIKCIV